MTFDLQMAVPFTNSTAAVRSSAFGNFSSATIVCYVYVSNPKEKIDDFAILFRDVICLYILYICALCVCVCRARDPYVYII